MPLEIKELIVRVNVAESGTTQNAPSHELEERLREWKAQILRECANLLKEQLAAGNER